ncbi:hypothetical protein COO60DRAFT_1541293 [Scenedesmus sp. NREL 46B-D3]|nr:hypothetical protein COO60DRAFT_1541293 [Scenedesmus sp. NREL 46B-D3]
MSLPAIPISDDPATPGMPAIPGGPIELPPGLPTPPGPVGPPQVSADGSAVCPAMPDMCSEDAAPGSGAFCPVANPFTRARCQGGCCFSSGRCKMPLCKLNGLGAEQRTLWRLQKCRNLACLLAKPGCQSSLLGGNCVGTVVAANDNLDEMAKQYIGKPCIEVVNHPGPLLHMPLNKPGLPVPNGGYMGSLWTVCDCHAQPSPVLPAVPCFDLKKHLLGKMHPLFAALVAGLGDDSCQGPLCALLPQLPVLNTSFPEIQIPMTLLANLTAMLKPKPLPDMAPLAGLIPAIQLPDIQVSSIPLTLPDLPSFDDCVANFAKITAALQPAFEAILPASLSKPDLVHLVSSLLPQMRFEAPQLDIVAEVPRIALPNLVTLVKAALPKLPLFPQFAVNFPQLRQQAEKTRVAQDVSQSASQS